MGVGESELTVESVLRLGCFAATLAVMALWEIAAPRRVLRVSKPRRWAGNLAVLVLDTALVRVLFPAAAVGVALYAGARGWGLFGYLDAPPWLEGLVCVIALDLAIYLQHVLLHAVPVLWRVHRMHHADLDFDVSTGGRFHPIEIVVSMLIKSAVIVALGAPALAVMIFEILLSTTSLFNHGNVRVPLRADRWLRWVVVTPDMHRVHHSVEEDETNSNFGFNLPWWDRALGTYRGQPRAGHRHMDIGLRTFRDARQCQDLAGMLAIPFTGGSSGHATNPRSEGASSEDGGDRRA